MIPAETLQALKELLVKMRATVATGSSVEYRGKPANRDVIIETITEWANELEAAIASEPSVPPEQDVSIPYDLSTGRAVLCSCAMVTGGARALNTECPIHGSKAAPSVPGGEALRDGIRFDAATQTFVARHTVLSAGRTADEARQALASAIRLTATHWPTEGRFTDGR